MLSRKGTITAVCVVVAALVLLVVSAVRSQQQAPSNLPGCQYNASLPTLGDNQTVVLQCDINGKLLVH